MNAYMPNRSWRFDQFIATLKPTDPYRRQIEAAERHYVRTSQSLYVASHKVMAQQMIAVVVDETLDMNDEECERR
jgi:hypothetical protein